MAAGLAILTVGPLVAIGTHSHQAVAKAPAVEVVAHHSAVSSGLAIRLGRTRPVGDPEIQHSEETPAPAPVAAPPAAAPAVPAPLVPVTAPAPPPAPRPALVVPPPAAAPVPVSGGSIESIIRSAAARHGVSGDWMMKIARCESGLNPRASNPHGYYGLFQFAPSTFRGHGGTDIWDPNQQAEITATMLSQGQAHQWSCA